MAKFKVRVRDREWIEERVRPAIRKHMLNEALNDQKITNQIRDFNLRNKAIQKEIDKAYKLRDKLHSDIDKFNKSIEDKNLAINNYRYASDENYALEWNHPELWHTVKDTIIFNAEDNLSVTSLSQLQSITFDEVIKKLS